MKHRVLSQEELADRWHKIKPLVNKSLAYGMGDVTAHGLYIECLGSISQCWVMEDEEGNILGAAITRILTFATYKELVIVTTTITGWSDVGPNVLEDIEEFARGIGCKYTTVHGRKGWKRVLDKHGYKSPYITLMKEL